jgi:hypothetical protein
MSLTRPSGPRPFVDGTNTTMTDVTEAMARLMQRCMEADEKMVPAEYDAVVARADEVIKVLKRLQTSARHWREEYRPKKARKSLLTELQLLSRQQPPEPPQQY